MAVPPDPPGGTATKTGYRDYNTSTTQFRHCNNSDQKTTVSMKIVQLEMGKLASVDMGLCLGNWSFLAIFLLIKGTKQL